jgi:hypothetical protein
MIFNNRLEKRLYYHNTDWMHTRLADIYFLAKNNSAAIHHYNLALSINNNYDRAKEGLARVDSSENPRAPVFDPEESESSI